MSYASPIISHQAVYLPIRPTAENRIKRFEVTKFDRIFIENLLGGPVGFAYLGDKDKFYHHGVAYRTDFNFDNTPNHDNFLNSSFNDAGISDFILHGPVIVGPIKMFENIEADEGELA